IGRRNSLVYGRRKDLLNLGERTLKGPTVVKLRCISTIREELGTKGIAGLFGGCRCRSSVAISIYFVLFTILSILIFCIYLSIVYYITCLHETPSDSGPTSSTNPGHPHPLKIGRAHV